VVSGVLYGAPGLLGKASRFYSFARGLSSSDVLVMGGGSVIGGVTRSLFRQRMMVSARASGKLKLAAVGVSIGPIESVSAEDAVARFVESFDYISVRDKRSYDLAVRMGVSEKVHLGRDLAGLLPLITDISNAAAGAAGAAGAARRDGGDGVRIGVAPCNYRASSYDAPGKEQLLEALTEQLVRLAGSRRLQVDIFSLNEHAVHGDHALACELEQKLVDRGVGTCMQRYRGRSPLSVDQAIGECGAFISVRLHGAIVAYLQGVPFAIVDYHPKCNDFADEVGLSPVLRIRAGEGGLANSIGGALAAMLSPGNEPALPRDVYCEQAQDIFTSAPWSVPRTSEIGSALQVSSTAA
jgi:polysaccharide pyruvyl transferase WcaK-like protein